MLKNLEIIAEKERPRAEVRKYISTTLPFHFLSVKKTDTVPVYDIILIKNDHRLPCLLTENTREMESAINSHTRDNLK